MRRALAAFLTELGQLDFALHFLLVLGSKVVRALALRTLQADEVILRHEDSVKLEAKSVK